jgi:predicted Zn-dependent protease
MTGLSCWVRISGEFVRSGDGSELALSSLIMKTLISRRLSRRSVGFGRSLGFERVPATLLLVMACASGGAAFSLVSVEQEVEIGKEAQAETRKQTPELRDEALNSYVANLGRRLAEHAPGAKYPYTFSVANYKELNAFALPGGPVWVHRGTLDAAKTEAQLAGVMAHEVAHIAQRHAADQLTKGMVAQGILGLIGAALDKDGKTETAARIGAQFATQAAFMKFSRNDESEADRVGTQIMAAAGWDPHGLLEFMQILSDQQKRSPSSVEVFMSSHPSPASRVDELRRLVADKSGRRDSDEFQQIHRRLASLEPAKAMPRQSSND